MRCSEPRRERRGCKEKGHGYIPFQMKISQKECREFRNCTISLDDYVQLLISKGVITGS
jgi:hypothetical protein